MKFINKQTTDNQKKKINLLALKKTKWLIFFLIIFFFGIWTERFDFKSKIFNFSEDLTNTLFNRYYTTFNRHDEKLIIDIKYKNYQKILKSRKESIKVYRASEDLHKWVPAKVKYKDKSYKAEIKLKGVHRGHWSHPNKWSFKIKLDNNKSITGIKRFSIQQPKTRDYLYEWIFMKVLEKEKLIFHRTKYVETIVNGNNLGIYFMEEQHTKELIENNRRREGPIIGLDKNLWIKEANNLKKLSVNVLEDAFWRAKVKPVQFNKNKSSPEQKIYLMDAINSFENFRNGTFKVEEVFELKQLAKLMSAKAIFGAVEFDWRDIKFYYNPITSLLEPIGREVHISHAVNNNQVWWLDNGFLKEIKSEQNHFLELLFNNKKFYKIYLSELYRMTDDKYVSDILKLNQNEFTKYRKILKINFPTKNTYSEDYLKKIRLQIRNSLNPVQGINTYFVDYQDNQILLSVHNTQLLPVEIKGIKTKNNKKLNLAKPLILDGKQYNRPTKSVLVKIPCKNNSLCTNFDFDETYLTFNFLGQDNVKNSKISNFYKINTDLNNKKLDLKTLMTLPFIDVDLKKKEINFNQGKINIEKTIVIPENFVVNFKPGTEIILSKKGHIISYSPINMIGTDEDPIIFRSDFEGTIDYFDINKKKFKKSFGYGLAVINADEQSIIENTIFKRLSYPYLDSGFGFLGSINFYNSDIIIKHTKFLENLSGDDYLNIVSSNFKIEDVNFTDIKHDAIDFDFSNGIINNISIINSNNDALDFSGSNVNIKNVLINGVGDKGISAGEKSNIIISGLKIRNANIGIASKDLSKLTINNVEIKDSKIGIAAYQKKTEYGPGYVLVNKILLNNITKDFLAENNSTIIINNEKISFSKFDFSEF